MRTLALALGMSLASLAQGQGLEEAQGAIGAAFPAGPSDRLRDAIGPAKDGLATLLALPVGGVLRLHGEGEAGLYLLAGLGIYHRQLELTEPASAPLAMDEPWVGTKAGGVPRGTLATTRGGLNAGLGLEIPMARGNFFVEVRYHRGFTQGLATEFVPVVVGTRF